MEKAYNLMVKANYGKPFKYLVDLSGYSMNYSSCSNSVNFEPIKGKIKAFDEKIINKMKSEEKIIEKVDGRLWPYKNLIGKYFDIEGLIYRVINCELFPSIHSSKYLCKKFNEL